MNTARKSALKMLRRTNFGVSPLPTDSMTAALEKVVAQLRVGEASITRQRVVGEKRHHPCPVLQQADDFGIHLFRQGHVDQPRQRGLSE